MICREKISLDDLWFGDVGDDDQVLIEKLDEAGAVRNHHLFLILIEFEKSSINVRIARRQIGELGSRVQLDDRLVSVNICIMFQ